MQMDNNPSGSATHLKSNFRVLILILCAGIVAILVLATVTSTLAQGANRFGNNLGSYSQGGGTILQLTTVLTDTLTATPTATNTQVVTPTLTTTSTSTATQTPTPTGTATSTGTATLTATPTVTGTPPTSTPTVTHTRTPSPAVTLSVIVAPTQAKVGETLTFTIKVTNSGSITTTNNIVSDSFPTFIDVSSVSTSEGSITKLTHSFTASIGSMPPSQVVTITTVVRVNSTLSRTETLTNIVTLTYNTGQSLTSSVNYQVVYQTLPPTGDLPLNWRAARFKPIGMLPGLLMMGVGGVLIFLFIWFNDRPPKQRMWMAVGGVLLILIGFIYASSTFGLFTTTSQTNLLTPTNNAPVAQAQPMDSNATPLPWRPASAYSTPDSVIPIVTLPDYPIPTPVVTITPQPGEPGPDLSPVERIVIPAIFLDTIVKYVPYDGYSWMISGLRHEIAWMGNTSWPGLGSNTGLAGHVTVAGMGDGPFRHLDELSSGEVVILYTEKNIYTYQVRESHVTDGGDMSVTLPTDNPQISLITCVDWDNDMRTYMNRLVVVADLVRTEPITMGMLH